MGKSAHGSLEMSRERTAEEKGGGSGRQLLVLLALSTPPLL